jgi:dienelactone hydrolase
VATAERVVLRDERRDKDLEVRVTWSDAGGPQPVIVFSHGMFGSKDGYQPLVQHWASHGSVVVQPTHADSLSLESPAERRAGGALRERVRAPESASSWRDRVADVVLVLDSLAGLHERVEGLGEHALDLERIGVGGHSFGAHTTMLTAGMRGALGQRSLSLADERPDCFLVISPQGTSAGVRADAWQDWTRPALFVTGTNDVSPRTGKGVEWRLEAWRGLAPGDKYLLFVEGADHGFGGISGARSKARASGAAAHLDAVLHTSTAFFDAHLRGSAAGRRLLEPAAIARATAGAARLSTKPAPAGDERDR